jgi:hypothetical protein
MDRVLAGTRDHAGLYHRRVWAGPRNLRLKKLSPSSTNVEYVFAAHIEHANAFARAQGWRPGGRTQWLKPDGTVIYFLSLPLQLRIVSAGEVVHIISRSREAMRILKRRGAVAIHHNEATAQ